MNAFETKATVEEHGHLHVAGVPFAPGTEVAVTISPKALSKGEVSQRDDEAVPPGSCLSWRGNVLVHQGAGAGPSVAELRHERLNRVAQGRPG